MTIEKTPSSTSVDSIVLLPCPGPQPDEAKSGWEVSFSFLKSLSDAAEEAEGSMVTMEAVEAIILALRARGHVVIRDDLKTMRAEDRIELTPQVVEFLSAEQKHWEGVNADRYWQTTRIINEIGRHRQ